MMKKHSITLAALFITIGLTLGLGISFNLDSTKNSYSEEMKPEISQDTVDILSQTNRAMAELIMIFPACLNCLAVIDPPIR